MDLDLAELIEHPERLNSDTLYELRELVARYPYYQTARLLFLQNLFLLHDTGFGEELRKAALLVPDRRVLFRLVEGHNYDVAPLTEAPATTTADDETDRTQSLIDRFLLTTHEADERPRRRLTPLDATKDYAAFLTPPRSPGATSNSSTTSSRTSPRAASCCRTSPSTPPRASSPTTGRRTRTTRTSSPKRWPKSTSSKADMKRPSKLSVNLT